MKLETFFLEQGVTINEIKQNVEKQLAVFEAGLHEYKRKKVSDENHPVNYYLGENKEAENYLEKLENALHSYEQDKSDLITIIDIIKKLPEFEVHYIKKENIIFPYMENLGYEKTMQVMWSIDDDICRLWKKLKTSLPDTEHLSPDDINDLKMLTGLMKGMIFKENKIVFPVLIEMLTDEDWEDIIEQSIEEGFSFITPPIKVKRQKKPVQNTLPDDGLIALGNTGKLSVEEILMMLNTLPVDITYVDENERVRYFSKAKDRIFPRSPAVIGREVQYCHPAESVHMVNQVIQELKDGKDSVDFWINLKGRFVYIRYFAMRNENDDFKGVLEVSQDLTEARALQGEKRLLDHS